MKKIIIAVDGPSSSGKSTFAKAIAREMGYVYIDSGAMYRACTLYFLQQGIIRGETIDIPRLLSSLDKINIQFKAGTAEGTNDTWLNGKNVEKEIRSMEISEHVSAVSKISQVRHKMVEMQRKLGINKGVVMDGRDIGTVVFPQAEMKIYLVADEHARAGRRYLELIGKGENVDYETVLKNISSRDRIDSSREESPLRKADDALLLDNSHMTLEEEMDWFRKELKKIIP